MRVCPKGIQQPIYIMRVISFDVANCRRRRQEMEFMNWNKEAMRRAMRFERK
jgi:hypothetical protein